jgi:hypothetical protein
MTETPAKRWTQNGPLSRDRYEAAVVESLSVPSLWSGLIGLASQRGAARGMEADAIKPSMPSQEHSILFDLQDGLAQAIVNEAFGLRVKGNNSEFRAKNLAGHITRHFTVKGAPVTEEESTQIVEGYARGVREAAAEAVQRQENIHDMPV